MKENMYDKNGVLKPEYQMTDAQKRENLYAFDKKIYYKGEDGNKYYSYEELEKANKAYFDYLNSIFNTNDKNMSIDTFKEKQKVILSYIKEKYEDYIEDLLKYKYEDIEENKGQKK